MNNTVILYLCSLLVLCRNKNRFNWIKCFYENPFCWCNVF